MRRSIQLALLLVAATTAASVSMAQERASAAVIDAVVACRKLADTGARLACFDAASAKLETATAAKELVVIDRDEVKKTRRALFGFTLPKLPFFGNDRDDGKAEDEAFDQIDTTIKSVRRSGYAFWVMTLADGAVWQTIEIDRDLEPRPGDNIRIRKASLGSFAANIDGRRAVKVNRVG